MDNYDPIRVLGEGSFGKVYLMRNKRERGAGAMVCVKVIKLKNIPRKEREACKKEVDLLRRLNHPNICGYRDSFMSRNRDSLCIVMEFCDGGDLSDIIKKAKRQLFSEAKILHYFVQMSLGLHYMHSRRILHRDLKTQNIFLLGNGRLVLGDLGICKVLEGTSDFAKTCIGTPYYMSPEIFKNKPYSHKADIWALGCVLYEMVTLKHAFDGSSINQLASKIIKGKFPPISSRYSAHLKDLITAMLHVNPSKRPSIQRILTLPFIKRHIQDFISDIVNRPVSNIGAGTKMVKVAAINLANDESSNAEPKEVVGLKEQLKSLGLQNLIAKVAGIDVPSVDVPEPETAIPAPLSSRSSASNLRGNKAGAIPSNPVPTPLSARRKEQARANQRALTREEERKKAVETALARLRQEREERLQRRNKLGVHNRMPREPMKNPLPSAARGNMARKNSNASKLHPESKAPLRRNYSNYNQRKQPPAKQVAELENWEERRRAAVAREKEKQRAAAAKERAIMERRGAERREKEKERREKEKERQMVRQQMEQQKLEEKKKKEEAERATKAKERMQMQLPSSNFPQHHRPSGAQQKRRPVPPALQEKLGVKKNSVEEKQKKTADLKAQQMEAIAKLKRDKEILDQRMKSKMMSKGKPEPELKGPPIPARNPPGAAADKIFVPAIPKKPSSKRARQLPSSVSEAQIVGKPENEAAKEGGRVGKKSASSADLVKGKGSGANPVVPKKVIKADLLANRIVEAAAKGAKGVIVRKSIDSDSRLGAASEEGEEESDGGDSSDFSQSDSEEEFELEEEEEEGGKGNDEVLEEREKELERELLVATLRCEELTETIKRCGPAVRQGEEEEEEEEGEKGPLLMGSVNDDDEEEEEEEEGLEAVDEGMIEVSLESSGEDKAKENKAVSNIVDPKDTTPKRRGGKKSVSEKTISAPTPENGRGSIRARVRFLQQRCIKVLGEQVYDRAYEFLKESQDMDRSDEEVEEGLKGILGEKRVMTFGNLIDQIVFMEQC